MNFMKTITFQGSVSLGPRTLFILLILTDVLQASVVPSSNAKDALPDLKSKAVVRSSSLDYEHDPFVDYAVRLMGCDHKVSLQAGRLEIFYKNKWGSVCNDGFGNTDARVACYSLGFTRYQGTTIRESFGPSDADVHILLAGLACEGEETALNGCRHRNWLDVGECQHKQDVSVACVDEDETIITGYPVRLANTVNNDTLMGRVEIFHNGCWGTVCDDGFTDFDAMMACRSVDPSFRKGRLVKPEDDLNFGPGEGQIWLDNVNCTDIDINIGYCAHDPWGVHDCHHDEDVAVICEVTGCDLNPCENGARCIDDPEDLDKYTCECRDGYYGTHCELDRCMVTSCENGGTCQITGDLCLCPPHYRGEYCEIIIGGCEGSPCKHGGTCHEFGIEYTCECNVHYTGYNCETVIGGCESMPCQDNATCIEDGYNYTCLCPPGFSGRDCERLLYGCEIERCFNGGTCLQGIDNIYEFTCTCDQYHTGSLCEIEIGGCDVPPCQNGGTCLENGYNYVCLCDPKFTGKNCEGIIGGCEDNRCLNGATCIEQGPYFTCTCPIGFTGVYCETQRPPSECGNYLHFRNITELPLIPEGEEGGWTTMCYLGNSERDRQFYDIPCIDLIQNTIGGSGREIYIHPERDFNCWFSTVIPNDPLMHMACKHGDENGLKNISMSSDSSFVMMAVCIQHSPWPWPGEN